MTEKYEIPIFVIIDSDGDYTVGKDQDEAIEVFEDTIGGSGPRRIVKLTARLTLPEVEDGPTIDIPDTAGTTEQIEVEAA